jgi:3-phosphoshikimate 1-carboxyvinyltransferase
MAFILSNEKLLSGCMKYHVSKANRLIYGEITLNGSKSISNRILIIRALSGEEFKINNISNSRDTVLMENLLNSKSDVLDAGAAGTTFRFLTALNAFKQGTVTLTGSARMKERPVGILVEALKKLGANIEYLEKEGFPPLIIHSPSVSQQTNTLTIQAGTSSQYVSALLMI